MAIDEVLSISSKEFELYGYIKDKVSFLNSRPFMDEYPEMLKRTRLSSSFRQLDIIVLALYFLGPIFYNNIKKMIFGEDQPNFVRIYLNSNAGESPHMKIELVYNEGKKSDVFQKQIDKERLKELVSELQMRGYPIGLI